MCHGGELAPPYKSDLMQQQYTGTVNFQPHSIRNVLKTPCYLTINLKNYILTYQNILVKVLNEFWPKTTRSITTSPIVVSIR